MLDSRLDSWKTSIPSYPFRNRTSTGNEFHRLRRDHIAAEINIFRDMNVKGGEDLSKLPVCISLLLSEIRWDRSFSSLSNCPQISLGVCVEAEESLRRLKTPDMWSSSFRTLMRHWPRYSRLWSDCRVTPYEPRSEVTNSKRTTLVVLRLSSCNRTRCRPLKAVVSRWYSCT